VAVCPSGPFQDGSDRLKAIDADTFLRLIRGQTRGPAASLARLGLGLCSAVYGVGAAARNTAYDRGWKRSQRAAVPVISPSRRNRSISTEFTLNLKSSVSRTASTTRPIGQIWNFPLFTASSRSSRSGASNRTVRCLRLRVLLYAE